MDTVFAPQFLLVKPSIEQKAGFTKRSCPSELSITIPMGLELKTSQKSWVSVSRVLDDSPIRPSAQHRSCSAVTRLYDQEGCQEISRIVLSASIAPARIWPFQATRSEHRSLRPANFAKHVLRSHLFPCPNFKMALPVRGGVCHFVQFSLQLSSRLD